jgi:hypothetical protein
VVTPDALLAAHLVGEELAPPEFVDLRLPHHLWLSRQAVRPPRITW